MEKFRKFWCVLVLELRSMQRKWNVPAGFLVSACVVLRTCSVYQKMTGAHTIHMFEGAIVSFCKGNSMLMLMGFMIFIADAPFVTSRTFMTVHRSGKKSWYAAMFTYILSAAVLYYVGICIVCMLTEVKNGYWENAWSRTFKSLVKGGVSFGASLNLTPPSREILELTPVQTMLHTMAGMILYSTCLGELLFVFNFMNIKNKGIPGIAVAVGFFVVTIMMNAMLVFGRDLFRWSLFTYAVFTTCYERAQFDAWFAYPLFLLVLYIIYLIGERALPRCNFEKNKLQE